jgi:hypothetical protein
MKSQHQLMVHLLQAITSQRRLATNLLQPSLFQYTMPQKIVMQHQAIMLHLNQSNEQKKKLKRLIKPHQT